MKTLIDDCITVIKELIQKYKYDTVYFSADKNGKLGTSIFEVNKDVINYITEKIMML